MKVEVNGKTYCVETLIADNERLRKDVIESAKTNRLVLDKIRAEIEEPLKINEGMHTESAKAQAIALSWCIEIIDKYKTESEG
jgi:hypothetical protein